MLVCQQLRHIINNDVITFLNRIGGNPGSSSHCVHPVFAAAAGNVGKFKNGGTLNSLEGVSYILECLSTDETVSLRGVQSQTKHTLNSITVPKRFLKFFP